jgi:hypothetical protein
LLLDPTVLEALEYPSAGVVGYARDDRDFVPILNPAATMLMGAIGRSIDFRWEIMRDE